MSASHGIAAVVFDLGGVLLDWDPRYVYRELFADEAEMERFLAEVCNADWYAANDLGVPFAESCARLAAEHPDDAEMIWTWARRTEDMIGGPITGTVEILAELRERGTPCYALTNMEAETYPKRRERYPFMRWFDGTVVSSQEGLIKPDERIFRVLFERYDLNPPATAFIDDRPANVEAARSLGTAAHLFRDPGELRTWLHDAGVLDAAD